MNKVLNLAQIQSRIKEIEKQFHSLQAELDELQIVRRVIDRIGSEPEDNFEAGRGSHSATIAELILHVLQSANLSAPEIHARLTETLRPNLSSSSVPPTLTRLKEKNLVTNNNGVWSLVR